MSPVHRDASAGWPWRTAVTAALAALLHLLLGPAHGGLVLSAQGVAAGELWRLATGHLVHTDAEHLLWNLGGLLTLGLLFERSLGRRFFPLLLCGAGTIGAWLLWGSTLSAYCGLSGVLNTLLAAGLAAELRATGSVVPVAVGVLAVGKIAVEASAGAALFTNTAWPPVPEAHAVGFLSGLVLFLGWEILSRRGSKSAPAPAPIADRAA